MLRGETCDIAKQLITGNRAQAYGDARRDFERISELFALITGIRIPVENIPMFMICVKLSRECESHKEDNMIDLCGYADLLNHIMTKDGE